jgi:hypothetical protein
MPIACRPRAAAVLLTALTGVIALLIVAALISAAAAGTAHAGPSYAPQCRNPREPATRNPANPLMLKRTPTHGNPLQGADFFVAGPARGQAAGAIAQLLGYGKGQKLASGQPLGHFTDTESWPTFAKFVARKLTFEPKGIQRQIRLLEKIAVEPTPQRISSFSEGGTPAGVYAQTRKLFCKILRADPHTIPIVTTDFLHPELGGCATTAEMTADTANFEAQVTAMAQAIGRRPVALFLELDAVGSSSCMADREHSIATWETLVRYEAKAFEALPHTVVYIEGGYSDSNNAPYAARLLNAMGVRQVQGFFTNDTHQQWTLHELRYAKAVSRRTGNSHFVISTSTNGRGPLLNKHPRTEGVEDLCNPPHRGLGVRDTTSPGLSRQLDALLWVVPPGDSSGTCNGGPSSGTFWVARAEVLAANANDQLGPHTPSLPY